MHNNYIKSQQSNGGINEGALTMLEVRAGGCVGHLR